MTDLIALDATSAEVAGAVSYWSLSGTVELSALRDSLQLEGLPEPLLPTGVTLSEALVRGARVCCNGPRQLIRPLARGRWAFVQEHVRDSKHVEHKQLLTGRVEPMGEGKVPTAVVELADGVKPSEAMDALIDQILGESSRQLGLLDGVDCSSWLVRVATTLHATGLRDRGGIYFVPRDVLPTWRLVARVLSEETEHRVYEIPAMRTEEAVAAVLTAVRQTCEGRFHELTTYLAEGVSTRGLNAWERSMAETKRYVEHYVSLLGQALPDLSERLEQLTGALMAARLAAKEVAA